MKPAAKVLLNIAFVLAASAAVFALFENWPFAAACGFWMAAAVIAAVVEWK